MTLVRYEGIFVLNDGDGKRLKNQLFDAFSGHLGLSRVNHGLAIAIRSIYPPVRGPTAYSFPHTLQIYIGIHLVLIWHIFVLVMHFIIADIKTLYLPVLN